MIMHMCNDPETGASACLEDEHDSSPEKLIWVKSFKALRVIGLFK